VRARGGYDFGDTVTIQECDGILNETVPGGITAKDIRDKFADYFLSLNGEVPWEYNKI
jgi:hypothetical protein